MRSTTRRTEARSARGAVRAVRTIFTSERSPSEAMSRSAFGEAGLPHSLCQVYLLLRIGLPDAFLLRAEPAFSRPAGKSSFREHPLVGPAADRAAKWWHHSATLNPSTPLTNPPSLIWQVAAR